jgi:prepilin-type N-terminal cleavage/methylation domain-containing protein
MGGAVSASRTRHADDGVGLIELLVVVALLAVVGGIVSSGLVSGMRTTRQAQDRVDANAQLQRAAERISREIRAADPLLVAEPNRIEARVRRGGGTPTYVARVVGTDLRDGMGGVQTPVVRNVATGTPVFRYFTAAGAEITTVTSTNLPTISRVTITIVRTLPEQPPIRVQTAVTLRNR